MQKVIDDGKLNELFKQAIFEVIEEKRETVHDMLVEAIEDVAMIHAIQEGGDSGAVSRKVVFKALEGKA
jgi:hypothetical protein